MGLVPRLAPLPLEPDRPHLPEMRLCAIRRRLAALSLPLFCSQVCSVLESLEQEYKREEDWCGGADKLGPNSETDHVTPMISKHLEQKEAFLKVQSWPFGVLVPP